MAETPAQKAARLAERKRVDDFMSKGLAARRQPKPKPAAPTTAQVRRKGAESLRKKYTPSGLQSLVDVMGKKKKEQK